MKKLWTRIGLASATIAIFAMPQGASAEYYVPPSNSAATQYTEAFPTAGGQKQVTHGKHGGGGTPSSVLGVRNAHRLDSQGPEGQAAAEVAAATAPSASEAPPAPAAKPPAPAGHHSTGSGHSGSADGQPAGGQEGIAANQPVQTAAPPTSDVSGSSGLGSVLSKATGASSSGDLGILLPLAILAALGWSIAYAIRQRKRPASG